MTEEAKKSFSAEKYIDPAGMDGINYGKQFETSDAMFAEDVNKLVNNQMYLRDKKADLVSPVLTGTPKAPTAGAATDNTQIASTAFVHIAIDADRPYATILPTMANTAAIGTSDKVAREDHVHPSDVNKVNKNALITAAKKCKITYDEKGLVTGGENLAPEDIPNLDTSKLKSGILGIEHGGTGANNAATARHNLEITPAKIGAATETQGAKADAAEPAFGKNSAFNKSFGTGAGTVCQGNDLRLSDARPASDVSAWAKAATKPSYSAAEVGAAAASHDHSANEVLGITNVYQGTNTGIASSNTTAVTNLRFAFDNGTLAIFTD